ncbi:VOC family protein [Rhodoblastus sp.]|uniref:VOC family protein n=1 Tax=Rhodoblastus sp. TaxID=1962975 RepID=UPI003F98B64E
MLAKQRLTTCLWFDGQAEEAARFYVSLLPDSRIDAINRAPGDYPAGQAGKVLLVEFTLAGQKFQALNGGPQFQFTEAISMSVSCADQAEVDRLWSALTADGGKPAQCGWLKDRYGLSWQIVPEALPRLMASGNPEQAARVCKAMMQMVKLDVAELERAASG